MSEEKGIGAREGAVDAYMCLIDWECEAPFNASGNHISYDIESLKENRWCVKTCGIVKVRIEYIETIQEGINHEDDFLDPPKNN